MRLTSGIVIPKTNGNYGIENIKLIIKSLVNISKNINELATQQKPKGFFPRIAYWVKNLFNKKDDLTDFFQDMRTISQNVETIKKEFADIVGDELKQLIDYTATLIGAQEAPAYVYELPILLDSIKRIIQSHK